MIALILRDFRRTWPQLVLTDLLARVVAFVVITPAVGLLLKLFLLRAADGVLTDEEIALFLLRPVGLLALVVVGAVLMGVLFAESGTLMVIGFGAIEDRRVSWLDAVRYVVQRAWKLGTLGGTLVVRMLLISVPFLAAIGGIYLIFLRSHDINFYLTYQPAEFMWAVALAGVLVAILALIALKKYADWLLALPLVLFEDVGGREALRESARRTAGRGWRIAALIAAWLLGILLLSGLVTQIVGIVGSLLVPPAGGNAALMATGLALTLLVSWTGVLLVSIVGTALFPLMVVRLYRSIAGPGRLDPEPAPRGSLGQPAGMRVPGKAILGGAGALLIVVGVGGYFFAQSLEEDPPVAIIAHRGASAAAPENTMTAFERAMADGTDWIELDVQENADGVVIVAHDSDFMKAAGRGLKVWNATNDVLRDIDIGSWFGPEFSDQRTPTLLQALESARDRAGVVIELKYYGHDQQLESRVVDIVEQTGMQAQVMIMSLKLPGLDKVAALQPDWPRGLLNTASVGDVTRLNVDFLALNASAASYRMIRRAHDRGKRVYVWTINDPVRMSVMMSRGVDGIITDEPATARRVVEMRQRLSPIGRLLVWIAGETGMLRIDEEESTAEDA